MISFVLNGKAVTTDSPGGMPVLDWLRNERGLTGTKEGCREGDCGACTVVLGEYSRKGVDYSAVCSCLLPLAAVHRCHLVTIEGISMGDDLTPLQRAFYDHGASQCGFCTPGMIMSLTGFLLGGRDITVKNAIESLDGNICRCTGYASVQRAVSEAVQELAGTGGERLETLIGKGFIPGYFRTVPSMLSKMEKGRDEGGAFPVAGGTDVYVHPPSKAASCEPQFIKAPGGVTVKDGRITIGAGATVKEIRESSFFRNSLPGTWDFLARVSSTQIRNRATAGGNVMNGSPIADLAVLFLALGADVSTAVRTLPLKNFYLGYKQFAVEPGEVLREFSFPSPPPGSVLSAIKVCKREFLDIASVNSAALLVMDSGRIARASIAAGGVYPYPLLLEKTSEYLQGREITGETVAAAEDAAAAEIAPISDIRGSKEYKTELLRSQIRAHLTRSLKP